jgi:hypothetical protein
LRIKKGLIIADPWIGYILDGLKTWEMRSKAVSFRGWFGLIRKGTGAVYGIARLADVAPPLSPSEMMATFGQHRIPEEVIRSGQAAKWNTPWKLTNVHRLAMPVPYRHRNGAVTWVEFDPDVTEAIAGQLGDVLTSAEEAPEVGSLKPTEEARSSFRPESPAVQSAQISKLATPVGSGNLIGEVDLTQGNIDNSHIYLRSLFKHFPEDAVGGSNRGEKALREIMVDWGGSAPVSTDLDGSKRIFRARGWIKAFFELSDARAGDTVLVEQTGPYAYRLRLRKGKQAAS